MLNLIDRSVNKNIHDSVLNDLIMFPQSGYKYPIEITNDQMLSKSTPIPDEENQQLWVDSHSNFSNCISNENCDWLDYPTKFHTQFQILSQRNFKEAKPRILSKLNWLQTVGLGLMAGAIWFQIPRTEENLHDLQGWMFFSQTYWMLFALFGALNSCKFTADFKKNNIY